MLMTGLMVAGLTLVFLGLADSPQASWAEKNVEI